jgi:4-amino-4-deoxy-L-arabinose transferase-like glycosyltransferase
MEPRLGIGLISAAFVTGGEVGSKILLSLFTALSVYPVYRVLDLLGGPRTAWMGTLLWIFLPVNYLWTPFFYIDAIPMFFGFLGIWGLLRVTRDERMSGKVVVATAASFSLAVLSRRAGVIYLWLILTAFAYVILRERSTRRVASTGLILAAVSFSVLFSAGAFIKMGGREVTQAGPSFERLVDVGLWGEQVAGVFAQLNGFFVGDVALTWLEEHPSIFGAWAVCAGMLVAVFVLGLLRADTGGRLWVLIEHRQVLHVRLADLRGNPGPWSDGDGPCPDVGLEEAAVHRGPVIHSRRVGCGRRQRGNEESPRQPDGESD